MGRRGAVPLETGGKDPEVFYTRAFTKAVDAI